MLPAIHPGLAVSTQRIGFIVPSEMPHRRCLPPRDRVLGNHAKFWFQRNDARLHVRREVEHARREDVHEFIRRVLLLKTDDDSWLRQGLLPDICKTVLQPGNALDGEDPTAISLRGLDSKTC